MSIGRRLTRNFTVLLAGNIVGQVFNLLAILHLARVVTPSAFGAWNLASAWMLYLLRAGDFGLEVVGLRRVARNPEDSSLWMTNIVLLRGVLAVLLFGVSVGLGSSGLIPADAAGLLTLFALTLFPMAMSTDWIFDSRQEVLAVTLNRVIKGLLFFVLVVLFVRSTGDTEMAAWFYVASIALPTFVLFHMASREFHFSVRGFSAGRALQVFRESMPIGVATILTNYNLFAATLIGGYLLTGSELGYFTAMHRLIVFVWAYAIVTFHRVLIPTLTTQFHGSKELYIRFVQRFFNLAVIAAVPIGLAGLLLSEHIISLLYPPAYVGAAPVLRLLLWSLVLVIGRAIFEIALIASDLQRRYSYGIVLVSIGYTAVTPFLILHKGIVGAALASLIVETAYFLALLISFPHAKPFALGTALWKPCLAAIIGIVPALITSSEQVWWVLPLVLALYITILVLSKGLTMKDFQLLRSMLGKKTIEA
ncbi:MAG: oligosaccharide flippase family protein [Bacteroidota bacterium]